MRDTPTPKQKAAEDLYHWQSGGTNFTSMLYMLIAKADSSNRMKIEFGFPAEVYVWEEWQRMDKFDFYKKYQLDGWTKR